MYIYKIGKAKKILPWPKIVEFIKVFMKVGFLLLIKVFFVEILTKSKQSKTKHKLYQHMVMEIFKPGGK